MILQWSCAPMTISRSDLMWVRFKWSVILEWLCFLPVASACTFPLTFPPDPECVTSPRTSRRALRSSFRAAEAAERSHHMNKARLVWVCDSNCDLHAINMWESNPWPVRARTKACVSVTFRSCDGWGKINICSHVKKQGNHLMRWNIKEYCCTGVKCVDWFSAAPASLWSLH